MAEQVTQGTAHRKHLAGEVPLEKYPLPHASQVEFKPERMKPAGHPVQVAAVEPHVEQLLLHGKQLIGLVPLVK